MPVSVEEERKRRLELWRDLERRGVASLRPANFARAASTEAHRACG